MIQHTQHLTVQTRHQDTRRIDAYAIFRRNSWKPKVEMLQDGECEGGINALCLLDSTWQCWCRVLAVGRKAGGAEVESDGGQVVGDDATAQREGRN